MSERYDRNLALPGFGAAGQARLAGARVLVVGAGGLGSPVLYYLAAAGVGSIGIVEGDTVSESNLQRQVLYTTADLGRPKAEAARARLLALNPEIRVEIAHTRLDDETAPALVAGYDIIVDATDNIPARLALNAACTAAGRPWVHGAVSEYTGQVTTFVPGGPCYCCLYRSPKPQARPPRGVLGPVPGAIGAIQAAEAVKYLTGLGELLVGRLLVFDFLPARCAIFTYAKDPACPVCGSG
ncbi:MAG: UBA/THIF-type NAD/FAD binding protein [Clostridia bacterium 62_21]|nr:MAG: UBA/THIF-type NAD/FAD binding protein [Clostridia bacterium 62_21]